MSSSQEYSLPFAGPCWLFEFDGKLSCFTPSHWSLFLQVHVKVEIEVSQPGQEGRPRPVEVGFEGLQGQGLKHPNLRVFYFSFNTNTRLIYNLMSQCELL